ncbi:MAG TPA: flagellar biosynthesis protein FlhB [Rhodothermales bacterium]|nr:flagellar biosynthesis protein FlhB [Rhodothermales bacterium]
MSERDEKQHDPTPKRLAKAREEGNVFRSKEVISSLTLLFAGWVLLAGTPEAFDRIEKLWKRLFLQSTNTPLTLGSAPVLLGDVGLQIVLLLSPFFLTVMAAGVSLNVLQSGWSITTKPLMPKFSRVNPLEGIKRMFSARGLFEFLKSLVKLLIIAPIAYSAVKGHLSEILVLHTHSIDEALIMAASWIVSLVAHVTLAMLLLSAVDFVFQKKRHTQDLKMTRQEVTDEAKEQEGDPQMKGKRRQKAREMMQRARLDHAILKADVVITNPTHYAVALRYNPGEADAPQVLAKGIRKRALRMKALAVEMGVPMVENRPLARALYASVDEGKQIPEDLYPAVAAILAEVFKKRGRR